MTYNKPELTVLGDAACLIQHVLKSSSTVDSAISDATPAYDLDE
jgi:hypothetical protein